MDNTQTAVSAEDPAGSSKKLTSSEKWQKELQVAQKALRPFWTRGRRVVKRFMDDGDPASVGLQQTMNVQKYNVFWANVGILKIGRAHV